MKEWQIAKQELAIESQQASAEYRTTGRLASEESIRDCTQLYTPQISSNPSKHCQTKAQRIRGLSSYHKFFHKS